MKYINADRTNILTLLIILVTAGFAYAQTAEDYFNSGLAKFNLQDYRGAVEDYNRAIELNPNEHRAYLLRGNTKAELQDYSGAIQDYNKAIELNPIEHLAYFLRGLVKSELKDYRAAIEDYSEAIELKPNDADAYYSRGSAKAKLQDYMGALQDYNKVIELSPKLASAYLSRGGAKFRLEDYRGAIQDFDKAIELNLDYDEAYLSRGLAKISLKQKDNGCLDLSKAGELGLAKAYEFIREFCNPLSGKEINQEFESAHGFTISLSDDWIEIPRDVIDEYGKIISERMNIQIQDWDWDYGYQLSLSENWFQYPYILVRVVENERIPKSVLQNYKELKLGADLGMKEAKEKSAGLIHDYNLGEMYFDSDVNILFITSKMNMQEIGDSIALTSLKLTEKGYIQISGYSLASEADKYLPIFRDMAKQMKLDAHLVYTPRLTDSIPIIRSINWGSIAEAGLKKGLMAIFIIFILGALASLIKRLKKS